MVCARASPARVKRYPSLARRTSFPHHDLRAAPRLTQCTMRCGHELLHHRRRHVQLAHAALVHENAFHPSSRRADLAPTYSAHDALLSSRVSAALSRSVAMPQRWHSSRHALPSTASLLTPCTKASTSASQRHITRSCAIRRPHSWPPPLRRGRSVSPRTNGRRRGRLRGTHIAGVVVVTLFLVCALPHPSRRHRRPPR